MKINYLETRAAKVCLPFTAPHTQNRKDVNRISFLNRGYAFNCLVAVINKQFSGLNHHYDTVIAQVIYHVTNILMSWTYLKILSHLHIHEY